MAKIPRLFTVFVYAIVLVPLLSHADPAIAGPLTDDPMIQLNFGETVELKVLVDYVAKRLDLNVLYDEQVGNKLVTIKSPGQVPRSSLLGLLESALRMKGLVLVDADEPGWKRIVIVTEMGAFAKAGDGQRVGANAVTQVFRLNNLDGKQAEQMIQPLLTRPGGNVIGIPRQPIVIVTDFASNLPRIERVLRLIDEPREGVVMRSYVVKHAELADLNKVVQELVTARFRAEWGGAQDNGSQVYLAPIPHANQIIAVGVQAQVEEAMTLLLDLDVPELLVTRVYQFQYTTPSQINNLVQGLLDPAIRQSQYRFVIDEELGLLAVATTEEVHTQIQDLAMDLDAAPLEHQNPVRIYKLLNTEAAEVLATIRALEGNEGFATYLDMEGTETGQVNPPAGSDQGVKYAPAVLDKAAPSSLFENPPSDPNANPPVTPQDLIMPLGENDVRIAVDEHTNSILVIAPPAEQKMYERLITLLDQRRPQVMIEVIIVALDTSDGYSFGVEISEAGSAGSNGEYITFSSFGLSTVDPTTGSLSLIPGLGFNGILLDADIADVVIRALKTNGRASVMSSPRILVNDNTAGTLSSVAAEPFAAVVDSSNNTSTTTLGGNSEAGTTIIVTPRISVDDYLQLEYEIELSTFTGDRSENLPPPSQRNRISSDVTIPDGHTIVVGGINRKDSSKTITAVPFLGEIPILGHLFKLEETKEREQTMFVFIRPIILRDDRFADLKYLSDKDRNLAGLDEVYPSSEPLLVY